MAGLSRRPLATAIVRSYSTGVTWSSAIPLSARNTRALRKPVHWLPSTKGWFLHKVEQGGSGHHPEVWRQPPAAKTGHQLRPRRVQ